MKRGKTPKITAVIHPCIIMASCVGLTLAGYQLSLKPFYHSPPQLDRWICSTTGCREISALAPGTSSFSFFTDLGVCWAVSFVSSLLSPLLPVVQLGFFYPFLKNVISEALSPSLMGQWVHSGAWWHQLHQTQWDSLAASHRNSPWSPPTTKTSQCKPNTRAWEFLSLIRRQQYG